MKIRFKDVCLLLFVLFNMSVHATEELIQFDNITQETLYNRLITEFRCLVCQNQNIADSNAELAKDLRQKTLELIVKGKSEAEIKQYMQQRYGNFVLYSPPLTPTTWVLWVLPLVILILVLLWLYSRYHRFVKGQRS